MAVAVAGWPEVPAALLTVMSTVPSVIVAGTVAVAWVCDTAVKVGASTPPNFTLKPKSAMVHCDALPVGLGKFLPVIVIALLLPFELPDNPAVVDVVLPNGVRESMIGTAEHVADASGASIAMVTGATTAMAVPIEIAIFRNALKRRPRSPLSTVSRVTPANSFLLLPRWKPSKVYRNAEGGS